jgi:hypothetical protein
MGERRAELRMLANKSAKIAYPNQAPTIHCKVSDISLIGAQLEWRHR